MSLVNYSSSSSDDEDAVTEAPAKKQKTAILLPNPLKSQPKQGCSVTDAAVSDESNGRKRSFPHERGIWATYVYIYCPSNDSLKRCQTEITAQFQTIEKLQDVKFFVEGMLHISLTKTIILRHHWINEFIQSIEKKISGLRNFRVSLTSIRVYCNEERTRTFIGLALNEDDAITRNQLLKIVQKLDICLTDFNLPIYYENPSFHASILWCVGDQEAVIKKCLEDLQKILDGLIFDNFTDFTFNMDQLFCKCGNKLYSFPIK